MSESPNPRPKTGFSIKRLLPILLLFAGLLVFFASGANRYINFETLRAHQDGLKSWVDAHAVLAGLAYTAIYAAVVACSLPGGALMTIIGGFLFGIVIGGFLVVFGATLGATMLFLAAKTAFGDLLRQRAGPALQRMEAGFRDDAFSYLLVLRLVPVFPFFLVNLVPAFLGVSLRVYVVATLIGIIPGSFVFASVGNGLGTLIEAGASPDLGIVFKPAILGPLIGLSVLAMIPVGYKKYRARKSRPR